MEVILASASPRRLALLAQVGIAACVCPADFAELSDARQSASEVALYNAAGKCASVAAKQGDELPVVAADTIVVSEGAILGKPADEADAVRMLTCLSGRAHQVLTGVAVRYRGRELKAVCETKVYFRRLSGEEIAAYVATGEPADKAGAYGIQGRGTLLVEKIEGCYNNVVGLPLTLLYSMLKEIGANMNA